MSMLADRKRKQKWSLNPQGNLWSQDGNKFGQKMLEKMGWSQGKGLGANLNGMTEHVRVMHKSDTAGMGFKDTDGWTEHERNFSEFLQNLASNSARTENPSDDRSTKLTSLEKTSEKSRKRIHYHKFTRGKDLSRYSEKDLASIFGKKSLKAAPKEVTVEEGKPEEKEHDYGVQTHNAGSMLDYFSNKLKKLNKKNGSSELLNTEVPPENETNIACDLMLNVCAEPVPEKKQKIKTNTRSVVKRRRSVRFSTTEERIIPLDPNQPLITPSKSHDNKNYDLVAILIEESRNSMAETIDQYQAEVENDFNEANWNDTTANELMVGEIGDPNAENELLPSGETKLRLKHAQFGKPPSWLMNKTPDSYAKKSYKHLIKGDIVLGFNHSNLHEIKGYANHV